MESGSTRETSVVWSAMNATVPLQGSGNGAIDAVGNFGDLRPARDQADDLALGKHGAHAADVLLAGGGNVEAAQFVDIDLQRARHGFKKTAGAGSAFVLACPVCYTSAVVNLEYGAGLGSQIYNHAGRRQKMVHSACQACGNGFLLLAEGNRFTRYAGSHYIPAVRC